MLVVLGALLLLAGTVALYAREQVIDREAFADRAVEALDDDGVRRLVAREIVVNLIDRGSTDLVAARPLVESVVDAVVQTQAFRRVFRRAALEANKIFFDRDRDNALVDLGDAATVIDFALRSVSPKVAREIPRDFDPQLVTLRRSDFAGQTLAIADKLRLLGWLLPALALLAFVAAVALAPDRRVAVLRSGVAVAASGTLLAVTLVILRSTTLAGVSARDEASEDEVRDAVAGVLDAYLGDLAAWGFSLALLGVVVAAAAAALDPGDVDAPAARLARLARRPRSAAGRALRGAAALALGVAIVLAPTLALQVAAIAGGAYLAFFGVTELLVLLQRPGQAHAEGKAVRRRALAGAGAVAGLAVAVLVVAVVALTGSEPDRPAAASVPAGGCNGSRGLCGLRLNEAVFAGTHNSFSAADSPGWFIANQRRTIERQLADGIRLFLIDPHWGVESGNGRVRTDFSKEGRDRNRVAKTLPPEVLAAAERLVGRLGAGEATGERDVWLCHTVCELGATRMVDTLESIRAFLEANRGEIVILFIEPYVPPSEIAARFERAGLDRYLATLSRDEPLPMLRQLVRSNRRVVVFTEKDADGTLPWYLDGFSFVQDTPLGATHVGELSCKRARGSAASPLLMLNNWADLFPPRLRANGPFQTERFLLSRARRCERKLGLPVNLIAVDYYDQGDLVEAVAALNAERVKAARRRAAG
ncbi:MAG: hypothetical protein QOH58_1629 [Thermoleophilaceae bacterium]|nr:hypothetical protein [Thermoleophilaceae bacterium]